MIIRRFMVSMMVVACFGSSSFVTASRGSFDYNDNINLKGDIQSPLVLGRSYNPSSFVKTSEDKSMYHSLSEEISF